MEAYKQEFIELMVECDALRFGTFRLKSGRESPFFLNTGAYVTGGELKRLGEYYARAIRSRFGLDFDVLFGPAYKGIPLAVITATALHDLFGKEVRWCANRKETKDHGADAGAMLGSALRDGDRVLLVEDVTTSGRSIEETHPLITAAADVSICGMVVSLDRMEVGRGGVMGAQREIEQRYGFPVTSIVDMSEVVEYLSGRERGGRAIIDEDRRRALDAYYRRYGAGCGPEASRAQDAGPSAAVPEACVSKEVDSRS